MQLPIIRAVFFDLGETLVHTADRSWIPGAKEVLAATRSAGLRLGVISNTADRTRAELAELLPTDFDWRMFETTLVILSSEVGAEKPSPKIFATATAAAGLVPSECLFCTEDLVDTLAAQRAGMLAARIQMPPQSDLGRLIEAATRLGLFPGDGPG